jgi:glycosyltransferase involved in cell wall biosynthesis
MPEANDAPRYALIMPFLNESQYLPAVLESIRTQTLDHRRMYLLAIDNGSTDDGAAIVRAWLAANDIDGRVIRTEIRSIPHALNCGIREAGPNDYIIRLDAHTWYAPSYAATIAAAFERLPAGIWCVGGGQEPDRPAGFSKALYAALLTNPMGLGGAPYRSSDAEREVPHVYLGAWRPGVLQRLGGFDEAWLANEDSELSERLREAGGRLMRIAVDCKYIVSRDALAAVKQWHRYGFWRAQTIKRHPKTLRPRHFAPPAALIGGLALLASPWRPALVPLFVVFSVATFANRRPGESPSVTLASCFFFPVLHAANGLGLIRGALTHVPGALPAPTLEDGRALG